MNKADPHRLSKRMLAPMLALSLLPCAAQADNDPFWTYLLRPGDTLWRFAETHLVSPAYVPRLSALNSIRNPNRIAATTTIQVPYAWVRQQPASAEVDRIDGQAFLTLPGQAARPLKAKERIPDSATLSTLAESRIVLRFEDGSELVVGSNSKLLIDKQRYFPTTGASATQLRLEQGMTTSAVSKPPLMRNRYQIDTPASTTSVRGTFFRVGTSDDETATAVLEGRVAVGTAQASEELTPGQGAVVTKGGPLPTPEALLPAPALAGLAARFDYAPPYLAWPAVAGAAGYHVELYRADRDTLVDESDTKRPGFTPNATLPDGDYLIRIRSRASSGLEGADAEHRFVLRAQPSAPLRIGSLQDAQRGLTLTPILGDNGSEGARLLQLSDSADFAAGTIRDYPLAAGSRPSISLPARGQWFWRVARLDAQGQPGSFGSAQPVDAVAWYQRIDRLAPREIIGTAVPVPGARYRLELSAAANFSQVLFSEDNTVPRWRPSQLPDGRYWARVRILGDNGYHSESPPESLFWN